MNGSSIHLPAGVTLVGKSRIVLGSRIRNYAPDHKTLVGNGWGSTRPAMISNGGDPAGVVVHIRWADWGGRRAVGYGLTSIFAPKGGYYPGRVSIKLRAYNPGLCTPQGPLAYRDLEFRVPSKPGAALRPWEPLTTTGNVCH
ncbi:MAG: hypothetical protein ACRDLP_12815 [Solirubrobacteraceae bacterium]